MLDGRQGGKAKRARSGPQQREIARFLRAEGATPTGSYVTFQEIFAALPTADQASLKGSLEDGRNRFFEQEGDAWRLTETGMGLSG